MCNGITKGVLQVKSDHAVAVAVAASHQPHTNHTANINNNHEWLVSPAVHEDDDGVENQIMQKMSIDISSSSANLLRQEQQRIQDNPSAWGHKTTACWGEWEWCGCSQCVTRPCFSLCVMM